MLQLRAFEQRLERVHSSATSPLLQSLDSEVTPAQNAALSLEETKQLPEKKTTTGVEAILVLPRSVTSDKRQKPVKKNAIGESFAAPKQLNEPARIAELVQQHKRKSVEILEAAERKRAKKDASDPVAYVLYRCGYIADMAASVTIPIMKAFISHHAAKITMPRSATHPKRADFCNFLATKFEEHPIEFWTKKIQHVPADSMPLVAPCVPPAASAQPPPTTTVPQAASHVPPPPCAQPSSITAASTVASGVPPSSTAAVLPVLSCVSPMSHAQLSPTTAVPLPVVISPMPHTQQAGSSPNANSMRCYKPGCSRPATLVLRSCSRCNHVFHHICTHDDYG
eukprot:scpid76017/ scgid24681/ 